MWACLIIYTWKGGQPPLFYFFVEVVELVDTAVSNTADFYRTSSSLVFDTNVSVVE